MEDTLTSVTWAPPPGFAKVVIDDQDTSFDYEAIKSNSNLELWLFRAPKSFKIGNLDGKSLLIPPSGGTGVGTAESIPGKSVKYEVQCLPKDRPSHNEDNESHSLNDELKALKCLLPRRRKGNKLYEAPRSVSRQFIISQRLPSPKPEKDEDDTQADAHSTSADLLNRPFAPIGSLGVSVSLAVQDQPRAQPESGDDQINPTQLLRAKVERTAQGKRKKHDAKTQSKTTGSPSKKSRMDLD